MTERQRRFADAYCETANATQAAVAAGYSQRTAAQQGARMLKNVEIKKYIHDQLEAVASERILSVTRARAALSDIALSPSAKDSVRVRALATLIKAAGTVTPPPPTEQSETPAEDVAEENAVEAAKNEDFVKICLPWNGKDYSQINAVLLPDGSVVPLSGYDSNDVLIYQPLKEQENCEWRDSDAE